MTPPLTAPVGAASWLDAFEAFGAFHLIIVGVSVTLIAGSCWLGRRWRPGPGERRLRLGWIWFTLLWQGWAIGWYLGPMRFDDDVLPLQLCDLAALVAPAALWSQRRWLRSVLYFWAIGLSTQAFITPVERAGAGEVVFWLFWVGHLQIVGSAIYDAAVLGFRPRARDLRFVILVTLGYVAVMLALNLALGSNYGYVGRARPDSPTLIDVLGPWPWRLVPLCALGIAALTLAWLPWAIADRARADGRPAMDESEVN